MPSPQIDEAWDKLMAPMNIRVSAEELERSNQESVSLPGGGKLAWIGAFHQLHCVVRGENPSQHSVQIVFTTDILIHRDYYDTSLISITILQI